MREREESQRRTHVPRWLSPANLQMSSKVTLVAVVAVVLMAMLVGFYVLPRMEDRMRQDKMAGIRQVIDVSLSLLSEYHQRVEKGELTEEDGQKRALGRLRAVRYNATDYIWVNDLSGRFIMHPTKPELEGKPLMEAKDPSGFAYMAAFCRVASEQGGGEVYYVWPKPGSDKPVPKVSYVRLVPGWKWVIGTGVYEDDVETELSEVRLKVFGATFIVGIIAVVLGVGMGRQLGKRVKHLVDVATVVSSGDVEVSIKKDGTNDEIGKLTTAFETMVSDIKGQAQAADRIAAGDLTVEVKMRSEKDALGRSLRNAVESLRGLVAEAQTLTAAAVEGRLSTRGDAGKFHGGYRDIVQGVNATLDAVIGPLNVAAQYVDRISKGAIPQSITDEYKGDFNTIKENLNTCIAAVERLVRDARQLSDVAVAGKLSERADASQHQGDFRKIVEGVNATLDALIKPVEDSAVVLARMAQGDLTARVQGQYKGDHRKIVESINAVAGSLENALREVSEAVSATASASSQISSSTEEMAAGAQEQTSQAGEVASAVEEMTKTILENARNASVAAETAKTAKENAERGMAVVAQTVAGMKRIAEVVQLSAGTVRELGKSSDQIGEIISVIDDIADQTNLLALNAAIEAARAGEQGRGFAVVADEVRKLAERTTKATKEIAGMIKKIQSDTSGAVTSMEQGTGEVEKGKELADRAGSSLQEIVGVSQKVTDMVTQIAAASEEQSSTSEEISKNVEAISKVTGETAQGTQQIARAAEDLNRLTEQLQQLVSRFTVSSPSELKQRSRSGIAIMAHQ
jgi:methyl-accepting chemotaxis protein